jgi:uncharacterized membrane protein YciS (DUF1049 family)
MEKIYKYRLGRRVLYISILYLLAAAAIATLLAFLFQGGYISAWFISLIVAVVALMMLSIPRRVVVDDEGIEIQCIAEDTTLAYEDIATIRKVEKREMNACMPIFGAVGFFGHYGRFLNLRTMEFIHIYASRWGKFVEITDIDGNKYYISCEDRNDIVRCVEEFIKPHDTQENI